LDKTTIQLVFANVTEDDILLRQDLDEMAEASNGRFKVHYVLEKAPSSWTGEVGLVTKEMIQKYCPPPPASKDDHKSVKMFLCGPLLMVKSLTTFTNELGYHKPRAVSKIDDQVYKF
jgi:cytochrome-b5 reductase